MSTDTVAYRAGVAARRSDDPSPKCPYEPGSQEYKEFAEGFCLDPFPDLFKDHRPEWRRSNSK